MNARATPSSPTFLRLMTAPLVAGFMFVVLASLGSLPLSGAGLGAVGGFVATIAVLSLLPGRTPLLVDDDRRASVS